MGTTGEAPAGLAYHELHRAGRTGWARSLLGVLLVLILMQVAPKIVGYGFLGWHALFGGSESMSHFAHRMVVTDPVSPASFAYLNLALGATILVVMLVTWAVHGLTPGWVASIGRGIRWRWLFTCAWLSVLALGVTLLISSFLPSSASDAQASGSVHPFDATTRDYAIAILLLTPLQAAGEEYAFRGYLTQVFGSVFRSRVVAVLLPALLFALAHGTQSTPVFIDRFAFGVLAGVLVIATGGLEAGIAMHVLNNFLAFGVAVAFGDMTATLNPGAASWWALVTTVVRSLVYLGLVLWVARSRGLATRTGARNPEADFAPKSRDL